MSTATAIQVIGSHCDHRDCTAPVRVAVRFTAGDLGFCMHHWIAVEDGAVADPTYLGASAVGDGD